MAAPRTLPLAGLNDRVVARLKAGGRYPTWVLVTGLAGMFATTFPVTILAVSLPRIAADFDVTVQTMAWVISAPLLASAVALPVLGKVGDLYGHRKVFVGGFALATVVTGLSAAAWTALVLVLLRTATQVIGAATQPTSMALIMRVHSREDRVKALGWWSLVAAGSPAVGLVVGGPLVDAVGWRVLFLLQAGLQTFAVLISALVLEETPTRARVRFDVAGAATLAVGTGALMVVLTQGADWGFTHPALLLAMVVGPLGIAGFVMAERRAADPLLPLDFLRRRNFTAPIVSSFLAGAAYMGGFILAPLLAQHVFGYTVAATAFLMLIRPASYSVASPVGGHLATRIGERTTAVSGSAVLAGALLLLGAGAWWESIGLVVAGLVLQGIGNGSARPSLSASLANAVDEADLGIAAASQRMVFQVGSSFGITLLTVIYGGDRTGGSFGRAYVAGAVLAVAALVAAAFVEDTERGERGYPGSVAGHDQETGAGSLAAR